MAGPSSGAGPSTTLTAEDAAELFDDSDDDEDIEDDDPGGAAALASLCFALWAMQHHQTGCGTSMIP